MVASSACFAAEPDAFGGGGAVSEDLLPSTGIRMAITMAAKLISIGRLNIPCSLGAGAAGAGAGLGESLPDPPPDPPLADVEPPEPDPVSGVDGGEDRTGVGRWAAAAAFGAAGFGAFADGLALAVLELAVFDVAAFARGFDGVRALVGAALRFVGFAAGLEAEPAAFAVSSSVTTFSPISVSPR